MSELRLDVLGFPALGQALGRMAEGMRGAALTGAAVDAMTPVLDTAQSLAPYDPTSHAQHVRDAIVVGVRQANDDGVDVDVGPSKDSKTAWRARFVEFGTKAHVQPKKGGWVHPGTSAQPFLRPALDTNAEAVLEGFAAGLRERLALALEQGR